ncbi:MAG TPA: Fe2+-dependent dioxygenase [Steroidobacteraceae bacterium]|nr:Fe2+-dependent dioxygenase [Steroidobacteraceae bacterium]
MLICIDQVLKPAEAGDYLRQLQQAGWEDGAKTAGAVAKLAKRNLQLDESLPLAISLGNEILRRLANHPQFLSAALPVKIYPPRFNRYDVGGSYGTHVDGALMRVPGTSTSLRTDLSATLFLSDPEDYDGGELQIEGPSGAQAVKLAPGDMVLYPASSLHRVTPVTRGSRIASFMWIESFVRDEAARASLYDMDQSIQSLTAGLGPGDQNVLRLSNVYNNLLRRWAGT